MTKPNMRTDTATFIAKVQKLKEDAESIRDATEPEAYYVWSTIADEIEWMQGKPLDLKKAKEDNPCSQKQKS